MNVRLATDLWVSAYLARLSGAGIFAHVAARGDATAGAVAVKLATMNGNASLFLRSYGPDFERVWTRVEDNAIERDVDARLTRERSRDRDLWIIEVEDPRGRHLLDEDGLG